MSALASLAALSTAVLLLLARVARLGRHARDALARLDPGAVSGTVLKFFDTLGEIAETSGATLTVSLAVIATLVVLEPVDQDDSGRPRRGRQRDRRQLGVRPEHARRLRPRPRAERTAGDRRAEGASGSERRADAARHIAIDVLVIIAQSAPTSRAYAVKYKERFVENTDLVGRRVANLAAGLSSTRGAPAGSSASGDAHALPKRIPSVCAQGAALIGHALAFAPRPATRAAWERAIGVGFAVESACFFIGPFPGFVKLVLRATARFRARRSPRSRRASSCARAPARRGRRWGSDASWWSAAIQFVGTLLFNVSTFDAMQDSLSTQQQNRLVWAPDLVGSGCFLVSGALALRVASGSRLRPPRRDRQWTMAAVNLAGCLFFGVSAVASYVVPSSGSILDLAAANWCTALGALCFFIGALLLLPRRHAERARSAGRQIVSEEV